MPSRKQSKSRPRSGARRPARPTRSHAKARPAPKKPSRSTRPPAPKQTKGATAAPKKPAAKGSRASSAPAVPEPELKVPLPGGREHVLSLAFVRDGDEFLARLETDAGQITELKNRSLDQLLTLVASELEDLLE